MPNESETVDDVEKARAMAEAGDTNESQAALRERMMREDGIKEASESTRGDVEALKMEKAYAERDELAAGIAYEIGKERASLSPDELKQIQAIIDQAKERGGWSFSGNI